MNASTDALSTGALVNSSQVPAELLDSIEVGIAVLDRNFNVQVWNKFLENHGAKKAEAIIGDSLFSHFPEIEEKWLRTKVDPVFNLKSPVFIIWEQRPYLFKFGCNRPVTSAAEFMYQNVTMFPIVDKRGNVERFCMLVYDVTEQALGKRGMEHLNEELKTASRVDGLTGLYNRRYWQERFDEMHKLCVRREKPSTALMLDIDHFKRINDTYGHQAGDKVIKMLAALIKRCVRETDLAGRYGGEEFAIILNDSSVEDAKIVAERIRQLAQRLVVEHEGESISFTVSLGLAQFTPDFKGALAWLECADQALYEAKENGRNQYRIYAAPCAL
ncbi:MAG: diguanylate cyclase [Alteromonas macleodii]|jgi:diguanylate cyclase (GGDEF)-like protein|nr:diguanylate cyclase [Alteromonas macleodii]